ncbi:hypothetical protein D3X11_04585 [Streptococcus sp. X16XC17]|uniref:putative Ig domain-containing protein n=1 Tax=unclassified Streptococcus TaxID=2608887 RepID=UPI00066FB969|nr:MULTISPECIES: putative Ig domain-containing protein [unclassified Streptococcus]TCD46655.1 hypothetical protein D3X11_04585 [Streptococcus sp. X16XC17]
MTYSDVPRQKEPTNVYNPDGLSPQQENLQFLDSRTGSLVEPTPVNMYTTDGITTQKLTENILKYKLLFKDNSAYSIPVTEILKQVELTVAPQEQTILEGEKVNIGLTVNDPDFPAERINVPPVGQLPDGLAWDPTTKTITGSPKVDWATIPGNSGEKVANISFEVSLKQEDGNINESTRKIITISVKQDPALVPVGVRDYGYPIPILIALVGLLSSGFMYLRIRKESYDSNICQHHGSRTDSNAIT